MSANGSNPHALASVVVLCVNGLELTRHCVAALVRHTRAPWELIVVDDGSSDGTATYLEGVRDAASFRVENIRNAEPRGPSIACNQGLKAARGEYVVLVDNDVVVTDGWLDQLSSLAASDPAIGMTGPMSNDAPPPQCVEDVSYEDMEAMHLFAARQRSEHRGQWFKTPTLWDACLLIKRSALDAVGGSWDHDLAMRIGRTRFRSAVARDLFVHRQGSRMFAGSSGPVPTPAGRPRVSLTMIVRDEEANLPACLESVRGLFDEVVVVDTGSADRTREVARSFDARVFEFEWIDDFAAARNAALGHATGDYVFWLDADDRLEPPAREALRTLLKNLSGACPEAYVVRCACDSGPDGSGSPTVVDHIRLFPRRPGVLWNYRVHEQILPSLKRAGVPVRWSDVMVRHTGYADSEQRRRKMERDTRILNAELATRPNDPFVLFNLGSIALEHHDWTRAVALLSRSLAGSSPSDSITLKLYALIARAQQGLGDLSAARSTCARGLTLDADDAELLFRDGIVRRLLGDAAGAEASWRRVLSLSRPERFRSVDEGIHGHVTRRNLAKLCEERGDGVAADRFWDEVLAELPGDREALAARARLRDRFQEVR